MKSVNTGSNYSFGCYSNLLSINSGSTSTTPVIQITDGNGGNQSVNLTVPANNTLAVPTISASTVVIESGNSQPSYNLSWNSNILAVNSGSTGVSPALQLTNNSYSATLTCPSNGILRTSNLQVGNSSANVTLTCPSQNVLEFFGQLNCNTMSIVSGISSPSYTGGIYNDAYALQPPRAIPVSGTSAITLIIAWNPTANWTTDTVTVVQSYISDYPINTQSLGLVKVGSNQLQITFNTFNSYSQPSNLYSINYIVMNQS
jgi:hypothetical protein